MNNLKIPNHSLLILLFMCYVLFTCCDKEQDDFNYTCSEKYTSYRASGEMTGWYRFYYQDNLEVKEESSGGYFLVMQYNAAGKPVVVTSMHSKTVNEYDNLNRLVKSTYYNDGHLTGTTIRTYTDTLIHRSYYINPANDTTDFSIHYYNDSQKPDSVISKNSSEYYYYSPDVDSVIILDVNKHAYMKRYYRYLNSRKVYDELQVLYPNGLWTKETQTWEYNDKNLLIKVTQAFSDYATNGISATDLRYTYNEQDKVSKLEEYDMDNNLRSFTNYKYTDVGTTKIETFEPSGKLVNYTVVENTCR